jgi:hypothetical protein
MFATAIAVRDVSLHRLASVQSQLARRKETTREHIVILRRWSGQPSRHVSVSATIFVRENFRDTKNDDCLHLKDKRQRSQQITASRRSAATTATTRRV